MSNLMKVKPFYPIILLAIAVLMVILMYFIVVTPAIVRLETDRDIYTVGEVVEIKFSFFNHLPWPISTLTDVILKVNNVTDEPVDGTIRFSSGYPPNPAILLPLEIQFGMEYYNTTNMTQGIYNISININGWKDTKTISIEKETILKLINSFRFFRFLN